MSPVNALRHLVFFEALAETDEDSPLWKSTTAGLVVLRLLDNWVIGGPASLRENVRGVKNIRGAISEIDPGNPVRNILNGLVDAISRAKARQMTNILPRLMAYGRALDYTSQWALSNDVYLTAIDYADPNTDADLVIDAHMQMGYCQRMLGKWNDAAKSYASAGQIASARGDVERILRASVADAKLAIDRGNLPHAQALLDDAIEQTEGKADLEEIRSLALHDRAAVAYMSGEHETAVKLGYAALALMKNPLGRDRVLSDLAVAFSELGVLSAARDALAIVAATAQESYLRWAAEINLIEIAAKQRAEPAFEMYRRELADVELPTMLKAHYHLHLGRGYQLFGKPDEARAELQKALEVATSNKLNQLIFETERSLEEIEVAVELTEPKSTPSSPEVAEIAHAIEDMRVAAGLEV